MNLATNTDIYRINCNPVLHVSGTNNLFSGTNSGTALTTGIQNTFVGFSSGIGNTSGSSNSFVGDRSGSSNSSGEENVFVGAQSGFSNSTGSANVFVGHQSGYNLTTENDNVLMGYRAGYNLSGSKENVAIGTDVLYNHSTGIDRSVTIGHEAGYDFLTATSNGGNQSVQIGYRVGYDNGGGQKNIAIGYEAGKAAFPISNENVLIGYKVATSMTTGSGNTVIGSQSGNLITTGQENTFLGFNTQCGATNTSNTAIGFQATISSGYNNATTLGSGASVTGGSNSTAIGYNSNACAANTIVLGSQSSPGTSNETVVIGDCQPSGLSTAVFQVLDPQGAFTLGFWTTSDKRLKENIHKISSPLEKIEQLNGYTYTYKSENEIGLNFSEDEKAGLIAQELLEVFPNSIKEGENGYYTVEYDQIIPLLLEGVKAQQKRIENLEELLFDEGKEMKRVSPPRGTIYQNSPNPFSSYTTIDYEIYGGYESAELRVYNMSGELQLNKSLFDKKASVKIDGGFLRPGIYAYTLLINGRSIETKTMVVSK